MSSVACSHFHATPGLVAHVMVWPFKPGPDAYEKTVPVGVMGRDVLVETSSASAGIKSVIMSERTDPAVIEVQSCHG